MDEFERELKVRRAIRDSNDGYKKERKDQIYFFTALVCGIIFAVAPSGLFSALFFIIGLVSFAIFSELIYAPNHWTENMDYLWRIFTPSEVYQRIYGSGKGGRIFVLIVTYSVAAILR